MVKRIADSLAELVRIADMVGITNTAIIILTWFATIYMSYSPQSRKERRALIFFTT